MERYIQHPDLTELYASAFSYGFDYMGRNFEGYDKPYHGAKSEFIFATKGYPAKEGSWEGEGEQEKSLAQYMKPVSLMRNWWPTHHGDRVMKLWFGRNPEGKADLRPYKQSWGNERNYPIKWRMGNIQGTGCGMKIGTLPLSTYAWFRYLTLLRLPKQDRLMPIQLAWLKKRHFRFLDEGSIASYWVNGWEPEKYSISKENRYWNKYDKDERFLAKGNCEYGY